MNWAMMEQRRLHPDGTTNGVVETVSGGHHLLRMESGIPYHCVMIKWPGLRVWESVEIP